MIHTTNLHWTDTEDTPHFHYPIIIQKTPLIPIPTAPWPTEAEPHQGLIHSTDQTDLWQTVD